MNCIPVFIASCPEWAERFAAKGLPIIGDDIKSQVGATITHRVLTNLFGSAAFGSTARISSTSAETPTSSTCLERDRLESKKISKTRAVTSQCDHDMSNEDAHVGPSDYVPWLNDRKFCHIRMEGTTFGNVPLLCEVKTGGLGFSKLRGRSHRCGEMREDSYGSRNWRCFDRPRPATS